jgi:hypothetical protein
MKWIDIIQTIGIIVSILIGAASSLMVFWQIKVQTKQIKSSANSRLATQVDEINRLLFEYPDVFQRLEESYPVDDLGSTHDQRHFLMYLILNNFEQAFLQHKHYGYIDNMRWRFWPRIMTEILNKPYFSGHWQRVHKQYPEDFQKFIEEMMSQQLVLNKSSQLAAR